MDNKGFQWDEETTKILRTIMDENGVRVRILQLLLDKPSSLNDLLEQLPTEHQIKKSSLRNHLRKLIELKLVFQEKRNEKYLLVSPVKTRQILEKLDSAVSEVKECEVLLTNHKSGYNLYANLVVASKRVEEEKIRAALYKKINRIVGTDFSFYNNYFKKIWCGKVLVHQKVRDELKGLEFS